MPGILRDLPSRSLASNLPGPSYGVGADGLPVVTERLEDPLLPATEDNLVCLAGCKYYLEWLIDSTDMGEGRELQRYCRRFATSTELMDLSDGAVFACSGFCPRWWSLRAIRRWFKSRRLLREANATITARDLARALEDDDGGEELVIIRDDKESEDK